MQYTLVSTSIRDPSTIISLELQINPKLSLIIPICIFE